VAYQIHGSIPGPGNPLVCQRMGDSPDPIACKHVDAETFQRKRFRFIHGSSAKIANGVFPTAAESEETKTIRDTA
jgi:hypothetical protein